MGRLPIDVRQYMPPELSDFDAGLVLGVFIGEVHFGGDQRQPQVTLKMQARELPLLEWINSRLDGGKLYGPYSSTYKDGKTRTTYQLMFRGRALRDQLIPFLDRYDWRSAAPGIHDRYLMMKQRYRLAE